MTCSDLATISVTIFQALVLGNVVHSLRRCSVYAFRTNQMWALVTRSSVHPERFADASPVSKASNAEWPECLVMKIQQE